MMLEFLAHGVDRGVAYPGFYDPALVALSLFAAFLGSYAGLSVIQYLRDGPTRSNRIKWLIFGALSLGFGIFTMHFIGMLAFTLPMPVRYDVGLTALSVLPGILSAGLMLHLVGAHHVGSRTPWIGGIIGGAGIGVMHYTGMMAMHMEAQMWHDPVMFLVSILVAVALAMLALGSQRVVQRLGGMDPDAGWGRLVSPLIMAAAVSGMHYTAMTAAWFLPGSSGHDESHWLLDSLTMEMGLSVIFFSLIAVAILAIFLGGVRAESEARIHRLSSVFNKEHRRLFIRNLGLVISVAAVCAWVAAYIHDVTEQASQTYSGKLEMERVVKGAAHDLEAILYDLRLLTGSGYLSEYLKKDRDSTRKRLIGQFSFMARERRIYDQIRFIDASGMEIVRVNSDRRGQTTVVPPGQLQNKADSGYFKSAFALSAGEVHISRFDLNVEHGQVERPHKPMIRFAAPVFDDAGNKRGVIVLNYFGDVILDYIRDVFQESENEVYLIDKEGFFLLSPHAEESWGFMLDAPSHRFETRFPSMWRYLQQKSSGSIRTTEGRFIFDAITVALRDDLKATFGQNSADWRLVIHIATEGFSWRDFRDHPIAGIILLCILAMCFFAAWMATMLMRWQQMVAAAEEAALRELEFQKRALDEHAIVSSTDVRGIITYVNDKFVAISGYAREELMGQNHRMVKSDEHPPEFYRTLWRTIANGQPWHGEVKNLSKNGTPYWVRATIVPFLNEHGKPFKYVSIRTDVTAMKALESSLMAAKERAEDAAKAKSEFLANMSHEIRTPMNAIIGLSHLCLQTRLTGRQKDYIRKVHNSATSLLRIINDILDFSKIEAGRLEMESIDFTLEEVLGNMAAMTSLKAQEKGLEFLMETAVEIPPSLMGDPLRLGQILINLTNNAIKFTEEGEVAIVTELLEKGDEWVRLRFTVRDSGIGMTEEQRGRLFQAFTQADASITRKHGGTGLGLTISQRLIHMMGGDIQVESALGKGSRFIFDARFGISNRMFKKELIPVADIRGKKVLVVDDNESARNVIADYLTSFTFKVTKARDGKEAIVLVQEADMAGVPFDLIVMDYMMPEVDGITAAARIRNELGLGHPPRVIMATAYGEESVVKRAMEEAQVDGFLVKPINQSLLFEAAMEAFGHTVRDADKDGVLFEGGRDFKAVLSGARILLVEDNEINQQVAMELLEQANILVLLVENGKQAVDRVLSGEPLDGVLMDVQMPVMDGLTATREIRKDARFSSLPILAMTANAMSGDRDLCLDAGMQDHIAKPIDPVAMFSTMVRWIKPAHPQPLPAQRQEEGEEASSGRGASDGLDVPHIPGVDVDSGLRRMGGNVKAYLDLLARFRGNQGGAGAAIREALDAGQRDVAERLAHTLKGVSATIGADRLPDLAKALELAIKGNEERERISPLLEKVSLELGKLCHILDNHLLKPKPADDASVTTPEEAEASKEQRDALMQQAYKQLSFYDAAAENTLEALSKLPLPAHVREALRGIEKQLSQYDFDGAAQILKKVAQEIGLELTS